MALFAVLAMTLLPADGGKVSHAQTPTTVTLVSNTGQSQDTARNISGESHSQRFTTGSHQQGYTITGIAIIIWSVPAGPTSVAMTLHSGSATGTKVADFTGPSSLTSQLTTYTFTPTAALSLDASTRYWIVLNQTTNIRITQTEEDSEDAGSAAGWQIEKSGSYSTMIGVKGYENLPPPPTSTDNTVETVQNTAHTFTAANFNFMPATTEDTLTKVHIVTLPNLGTLALSGTAVTAGQEITKADIDAGNLKFTPVADEFGDPYTSFLFRVEGSSRTSTATYTMTIDVMTDSVPPALAATDQAVLAADGKTLTLTYNEPMKATSTPANDAFTVEATPAGGSEAEVELAATNGVSVSGSTVVLTLDSPIAHNDGSVKVTYDKPGSGAVIEDANGNEAPGFTDQSVTNNSLIPRVSIEALFPDASPAIANPKFKVTRSNTGADALEGGARDVPDGQPHVFDTFPS